MGWLHRSVETRAASPRAHPFKAVAESDASVVLVEDPEKPESYRPVPASVPNDELPFISSSVVSASATSGRHWLVIDNIVYDCTEFISEHPGGQDVLKPFRGHDCTWQFRRFHGKGDLQQGWILRVGRTLGVRNKFRERPRFVGLRPWGADYL
jgi:cytochrome b involved in lipid metabolism